MTIKMKSEGRSDPLLSMVLIWGIRNFHEVFLLQKNLDFYEKIWKLAVDSSVLLKLEP